MEYMKTYHFDQTDTRKYQKHIENEFFAGDNRECKFQSLKFHDFCQNF